MVKKAVLVAVVATVFTATLAATANAAAPINKQLWHISTLDAAASEIAGTQLRVVSSDSDLEWLYLNDGDDGVLGFTCPTCAPGTPLYNGYDGKGSCRPGAKPAIVAVQFKCLRVGQRCKTRYQVSYKRYGFVCVAGYLH